MISFVYLSYRPGGIDLLCRAMMEQSGKDYELIVVDDLPGRVQRGEAARFLLSQGIKLVWYGNSKAHPLAPIKCGYANAINTGTLHAKSEQLVFLNDFCLYPLKMCEAWEDTFKTCGPKTLISGAAIVYDAVEPTDLHDIFTWTGGMPALAAKWPWVPVSEKGRPAFEMFYYGIPLQFFKDANGIDERADHCICWSLTSLISQAQQLGYKFHVSQHLVAHMIDHREWKGGKETGTTGQDSIWRISGWTDTLDKEPKWSARSLNRWDFLETRKKILGVPG